MQVVYHLGAHCTDAERLMKWLLKSRGAVARAGTVIPGPYRCRPVLRDALETLKGAPASAEAQEVLLDTIMDEDHARRLVFSNENFLALAANALKPTQIYPRAEEKCAALRALFPQEPTQFFLAIRNPATFLPMLFAKERGPDQALALSMTDPRDLRWSDTVRAIRRACPDAPVTVWCDEDSPLVMQDVLAAMTGIDDDTLFDGCFEVLEGLMTTAGLLSLRAALTPGLAAAERHRIIAAHLADHGQPEAFEIEIDLPDWNADLIAQLTRGYDEDVERIAALSDVTLIRP
ncbi:hypothetical protein ACFQXB_03680 [Plastorhodobacter daqingensis]|uniref:Sulfotransferase family protein n=1 Tax=Plastorhodobacter daqingensis TaxID=1387281 RepID=A0ABW2UJ14_9RHOB